MALEVPERILTDSTEDVLEHWRDRATKWRSDSVTISTAQLTEEVLDALLVNAQRVEDASFERVVAGILDHRKGKFNKRVPRLTAAPEMIKAFIADQGMIDGWVYKRGNDGHLHPYLVTDVKIAAGRQNESDFLLISLLANGASQDKLGIVKDSVSVEPAHVSKKYVREIFEENGLHWETEDLKKEYETQLERYRTVLTEGFSNQYRFTGKAYRNDRTYWSHERYDNQKVIHDVSPDMIRAPAEWAPSDLDTGDAERAVPTHTLIRVFTLNTHEFLWVNTRDLTEHEWDHTLADKLVLPHSQRELLDILTTDISTFTSDIIEGKSSGNVIMCKGVPGVGKTLSAEIYSELIERPLYSIHSGTLGTRAEDVRKALEVVFKRAKRWSAVLLLDEADVFVIERGANIAQNAIVAEFLRTLEYFDGLMFMTTNRANNIDDAIISRCAAIINYEVPNAHDQARVWRVLSDNLDYKLPDELIAELVTGFEGIAPRDIKMLLRLALRVSTHTGEELSVDTFRRCAIFRGLQFHEADEDE